MRMLGMFMVLPVLTTYGMALQGASEALIGIAIGIYGLTQAVFQIPFGLLSSTTLVANHWLSVGWRCLPPVALSLRFPTPSGELFWAGRYKALEQLPPPLWRQA